MEQVTPFDWHRMFLGDEPPLYLAEILFRVVVVYASAVLLPRYMGKRGNRGLSPFENVVVIALGSAAGVTMFYPQVLLPYAFGVIALDRVSAVAQMRWRAVNAFLKDLPLVMVHDGRIVDGALRSAQLRHEELLGMLRAQGVETLGQVRCAILERSGELSVFRREEPTDGPSTWPDRLEEPRASLGKAPS